MSSFPPHQNGDCVDKNLLKEYENCREANAFLQIPSDPYDAGEEFGEPEILPRIGEEYQVELPPLIEEPNHISYAEVGYHSLQDFFIGLPIPLIWIDCDKNEVPQMVVGSLYPYHKNVIENRTLCNGGIEPSHDSGKFKEEIKSLVAKEKNQMCIDAGVRLVPGSLSDRWSDAEKAIFLLALYIFEKNFVEVWRFVGSKNMDAILSFYYGEFYGSDAYHRWSEGRKTKSKKCVYGQRIFSGSRQHEFMSRLLPKISEECRSSLLEVSKAFSDDKISLVEYVSSLKAIVGTNLIVEAVAIGSGKLDLTGMAMEPVRSNHQTRSEIPSGKACSALTTSEIIKFLSGDYRLSKARSNDLFWEAVWPRLLARGWHSEQPQNQGYVAGSKCLVFLLPGVKKFSRRKLVKGDHYFDSVTDVLSKVAKDPSLIELDSEEFNGDQSTEKDEVKVAEEESHPPSRQRHSYLQPRTPNRSVDGIKFTVVDTGLLDGKIRELRTLPREISGMVISFESYQEESTGKSGPKKVASRKNRDENTSSQDIHHDVGKSSAPVKRKKDGNENQKPRKVSKPLPRKQKQGYVDNIAPISKRCKKSTGSTHEEEEEEEARYGGVILPHQPTSTLENGVSCSSSHVHDSNNETTNQEKLSSASSSRGSPSESIDFPQTSSVLASEPSQENPPQPQLLIDLNLPHVAPEIENNGLAPDLTNQPDKQSNNCGAAAPTAVEASSEVQSSTANTRRLSTRYRPPTTRALEAVASGYLSISRRRKGRDTSSADAHPRPSQQPRLGPGPNESPSSSVASPSQIGEASSSQIVETDGGACTSGTSNTDNKNEDPAPVANQEEPPPRQ